MATTYECAECGAPLMLGDECYMSWVTAERMFCKPECMREWIINSNWLDDVVDEWMEDHAECCNLESEDPYDRYGVSPGDFA